jgi:hypothetical protein
MLLISFTFIGCSNNLIEGSVYPIDGILMVSVQTPTDSAYLDRFNFVEYSYGKLSASVSAEDVEWSVVRSSTQEPVDTLPAEWLYLGPDVIYNELNLNIPVLIIRWLDFKISDLLERSKYDDYYDSYEIYIKSPKIFGNEDTHVIKWDFSLTHKNGYLAYRCEVDGVEHDLDADLAYNKYTFNSKVKDFPFAFVTFIVDP